MQRSAHAAGLLIVVTFVLATTACGAKKSTTRTVTPAQPDTIVLHAPAQRDLAAKDIVAGESVVCVTHGDSIRAELPDPSITKTQVSGDDYASASGGTMSVSSDRTRVTITCR